MKQEFEFQVLRDPGRNSDKPWRWNLRNPGSESPFATGWAVSEVAANDCALEAARAEKKRRSVKWKKIEV